MEKSYDEFTTKAIEDAGIPKRFRKAHLYQDPKDPISLPMSICRGYVSSFMEKQEGMLFIGSTGVGKTHYACATANEVLRHWRAENDIEIQFFNLNTNLPQLLDMRYFKRYDEYSSIIRKLELSTLLIVDDLLHISNTEWAKAIIYRIYEARYSRELRTITTLNAKIFTGDNGPDWSPISDIYNEPFMRRVLASASSNIILI